MGRPRVSVWPEVHARLIAAIIAVFVFGTAAGAAPAQEVTLEVERIYEQQYGLFRLRFSGRISSGAANEYVAVLHQKCGFRFSTAIGGATTTEGGYWESIPRYGAPPQSGTFRALWKGHRSEPVTLRSPVRISLVKEGARRYRVTVNADSNLSRRFVALQRLAGGRWRHVRRVRLAPYGQAGYGGFYTAAFTVRKRGLRLRILVPEKTAAPCHEPAASQTFVS
jgi:hypothetical protein